jgi:dTDP-4-dehydrorhamnose reductase
MNTPIVIIGKNGMLGQDLVAEFVTALGEEHVKALDKKDIDITNEEQVEEVLTQLKPAAVINAAAFNDVDGIEEDDGKRELGMAVNGEGPGILARWCAKEDIPFVHFSTDYVFSGDASVPYAEDAKPDPQSHYARSKRAGEEAVLAAGGKGYVARTCRLFGAPGASEQSKESFVDLMLRIGEGRDTLDVVNEEIASPTYTPDLAAQARVLLEGDYAPGLYHMVNEGSCTWYEFAQEIFRLASNSITLNPVTADAFPRPAARPAYSALKNTKLPPMRTWQEALEAYMESR